MTVAVAQPDRSVTENADGTMEGMVTWIIDAGSVSPKEASELVSSLLPAVGGACSQCSPGSPHPDDKRLECYERTVSYDEGNVIYCEAKYFGLWEPSRVLLEYKGSVSSAPITKHPNWAEISTNAVLDPIGLFIGFDNFEETDGDYRNIYGTSDYLVANTSITATYWMETQPLAKTVGVITSLINDAGFDLLPSLPDGSDYLLANQTYRQVGSFYQVSEEYIASGSEGWSSIIYTRQ